MEYPSEEDCIRSLRKAANELDKSPTKAEYEALQLTPASATIINTIGSWNEAKRMAGLETFRQGESGGSDIQEMPESVDLPEGKVWRDMSSNQRWYYKNRERDIYKKEHRKAEIRLWLYEYKRDNLCCSNCGETHPAALDFHHPGKKELGIAVMVNQGYSKESIMEEMEECEVICANCHRKLHFDKPEEPSDRFGSQHS